jgi:hypothetical protein
MSVRFTLVLSVACLTACASDGPTGPQVVFSEEFNIGWPTAVWNVTKGPYSLDATAGSSPPSLFLQYDPAACCPGVMTNQTFSTRRASFRVDMQWDAGASGNELSFVVRDVNNATNAASVQVTAINTFYRISVGSSSAAAATEPMSPGFHTYEFVIEGDGTASLYRDGFLKTSRAGFPTTTSTRIELVATRQGHFDNVVVTVP